MAAKSETVVVVWMPQPQVPAGCPPGLEYLTQIDQILVQQQIDLSEMLATRLTGCEMRQNKFRVCNSLGQQMYFAQEDSDCCSRQCLGAARPFSMSITDNNQVEVIHLERPYRRTEWYCFCCLQEMEVQSPPGVIIGYIKQDCTLSIPEFSICNESQETVLKVRGPWCTCRYQCCTDIDFQVLSADGTQPVGKISKHWSGLLQEYFTDADNFGIQFPMTLDVKMKAVMLGACFLIDFMFFEQEQDNNRRRCF